MDVLEMELMVVDEVDASGEEGAGEHGGEALARRGRRGWHRSGEERPRGHSSTMMASCSMVEDAGGHGFSEEEEVDAA